jgi:hypothetical protein
MKASSCFSKVRHATKRGDIVGDLIEDYEAKHHPLREITGVQALKFLIRVGGLHAGAAHAAGA